MAVCFLCVVGAGMCCSDKPPGRQALIPPAVGTVDVGCWPFSVESFSRNGPQPKRAASPGGSPQLLLQRAVRPAPLDSRRVTLKVIPAPELPVGSVDASAMTALRFNSSLELLLLPLPFYRCGSSGQAQQTCCVPVRVREPGTRNPTSHIRDWPLLHKLYLSMPSR